MWSPGAEEGGGGVSVLVKTECKIKRVMGGTSLVVQWLRICLAGSGHISLKAPDLL